LRGLKTKDVKFPVYDKKREQWQTDDFVKKEWFLHKMDNIHIPIKYFELDEEDFYDEDGVWWNPRSYSFWEWTTPDDDWECMFGRAGMCMLDENKNVVAYIITSLN